MASTDGKVQVKEQLAQNSLFSSIAGNQGGNNTSISISGGNSVHMPPTESRLKQVSKGTHGGVDEDGTIGGASTQCPYPQES